MFTADIVVSFWTSVFWLSTAGVLFVYVGYPVLIWTAARLFGRTPTPFDESRDSLPVVSIIIAAHNEETVIRERIQNLLALDYPSDRLEILIASDGSTDRTCELVREFSTPHLRLLDFAANRGKAAVLNDAFAIARGDIAVLSDANTMMDAQAVRRLVQWFADERVGVVCGRLVLIDPQTGSNADGLYWKYETFLKNCEARLGALLGANGALYAIRRSLYPTLSQRIAVDDFVVPLLARINSGCRIEYDTRAVAFEETPPEVHSEFARRSRIGAGGFQSLALLWPLLNPLRGWVAVSFLSHKLLRWICPFFLVGALVASVALSGAGLYRLALVMQVSLYLVAALGYRWPQLASIHKAARLPTMFTAMNLALLAGFFTWVARRQGGTWARTARTSVGAGA
jgi:cellulose synthase/poly-beta-1,6-N-acetylglucosamine synthase-like glycosyltransferase